MKPQDIIAQLPYRKPFLFVDDIVKIDGNGVSGTYYFDEQHDFYKGHFIDQPVTPGVILTETMAQIGVVSLGIFLLNQENISDVAIALTSTDIEFLKAVKPKTKVVVTSVKKYFRFGKLKCDVTMTDEVGDVVCTGAIAGMIISK